MTLQVTLSRRVLFIQFWLRWVFVAVLAFSSCADQGLLFCLVCGILIEVASLVAEHGLCLFIFRTWALE